MPLSNSRVRDRMRPLDGCMPSNSALDVAEVMKEMGLRYMPVVGDLEARRINGAVSRDGLGDAIHEVGPGKARVEDARLLTLPIVDPDLRLNSLEERVGLAAAYMVAEGERLLGLYDPGEAWR